MIRHQTWEWADFDTLKCSCDVVLYPDCDASLLSISEAHLEHIIELFSIPLDDRSIEINT